MSKEESGLSKPAPRLHQCLRRLWRGRNSDASSSGRDLEAQRTMPHPREMPQSSDRIARIAGNVVVCRAFLRSVLVVLCRPLIDRYRPPS